MLRELTVEELGWVSGGEYDDACRNLSSAFGSLSGDEQAVWRDRVYNGAVWGAAGFTGGLASGSDFKTSLVLGGIGAGAGAASRVICTHLYQKGLIDRDIWRADMEFTVRNCSATTARGYHYWAIPYVRLMRRRAIAERLILPFARARAIEIAFKMGRHPTGSLLGKIVRLVGESLCYVVGVVVKQKSWRSLYEPQALALGNQI